MKIKHHSIFKELSTEEIDWKTLRSNKSEKGYYLPKTRAEYESDRVNEKQYDNIIFSIKKLTEKHKINRVISLGCGVAALEYHLNKKLDIKIQVSDNDLSIETIKNFKIFDKASIIDLKANLELNCDDRTLILLSRIDTELLDHELESLFENLSRINAKYIFFIPAQELNYRTIIREIKILIYSFFLNKKRVNCGYSRTKSSFIRKWHLNFNHMLIDNNFFLFK